MAPGGIDPMELVRFEEEHLDAAAELLARRHRAHRQTEPSMSARFEDPSVTREAVAATWGKNGTRGMAAIRSGRLVGYLLSTPRIEPVWGRSVWACQAGHALAEEVPAELYRDLYAALAPGWVAEGCFAHFAMVPAFDLPAVDAWFRLSFGQEQVHATREIDANVTPASPADPSVEIRPAGPDDLERLMEISELIADHQATAPVFGINLPEGTADRREGYADLLNDATCRTYVALRGASAVGLAAFVPAEHSHADLIAPERACYLAVAATRAEERGRGIARALTTLGLREAGARGYRHCITDWRATNLLSSRVWPKLGFRPIVYRLSRRIDDRIAWARGPWPRG
jgi:ribosomal protein S18 acetylase RimI-like enzyme